MKARKSPLAALLLANPEARNQFRAAMAKRTGSAGQRDAASQQRAITFIDTDGRRRRVVPEIMTSTQGS